MLPPGLAAHVVGAEDRRVLRQLLPSAQTVAQLLVGGCSCDLIKARDPDPHEDERPLRARYRALGLSRPATIHALERHRHGPTPRPQPAAGWPAALAAFVVEHARNAGPTLYYLHFDPRPLPSHAARSGVRTAATTTVRERAGSWLDAEQGVLVTPLTP